MNHLQPAYGAPALNGLPQPGILLEQFYAYVYDQTLSASQSLINQAVPINTDADFEIRAIALAAGSGFSFRIQDSNSQYRFSDYVDSALLQVNGYSCPFPIFPSMVIPAGGKIGLDLVETAAAGTTIQLVFLGVKRFATPAAIR